MVKIPKLKLLLF